jgi:hypothetical protein
MKQRRIGQGSESVVYVVGSKAALEFLRVLRDNANVVACSAFQLILTWKNTRLQAA